MNKIKKMVSSWLIVKRNKYFILPLVMFLIVLMSYGFVFDDVVGCGTSEDRDLESNLNENDGVDEISKEITSFTNLGVLPKNLISNPSFEDGGKDWSPMIPATDGSREVVEYEKYEGNYSLKLENIGWAGAYQGIGSLKPGKDYLLSVMFKTSVNHWANILLQDSSEKFKFGITRCGSGKWQELHLYVHIPESAENYIWNVYLYGMYPTGNNDPIFYDDTKFQLSETQPGVLPPFGPLNDGSSMTLDFGSDYNNETANGITYNNTDGSMSGPVNESGTTFRSLLSKKSLTIKFPAFNVDTDGQLLSPMVIEIKYKDTITPIISGVSASHRAVLSLGNDYKWLNYFYDIDTIGKYGDGVWRYAQHGINVTPFTLLMAVDNKFTLKITMPNEIEGEASLQIPIDYISLRAITNTEYEELIKIQRDYYGYYKINLTDPSPSSYVNLNKDLTVFYRDLMMPVYEDTRPKKNEIISNLSAASTLGEIATTNFILHSEKGINGLALNVSDLKDKKSGKIISKNNIHFSQIKYNEKRLATYATYPAGFAYAKMEDYLEEAKTISIGSKKLQRILTEIHVPLDIPKGSYDGKIEIKQASKIIKKIGLTIKVLPIKLDQANHINPAYVDPWMMAASDKIWSKDTIDELLKINREMGVDPFIWESGDFFEIVTKDNSIVDINTTNFETKLQKMIDEKYIKEYAMIMTWSIGSKIYDFLFKNAKENELYDNLSSKEYQDAFGLFVQKLLLIGNQHGIKFIINLSDEPHKKPYDRTVYDRLGPIVHNYGGKLSATYWKTCEEPVTIEKGDGTKVTLPGMQDLIDYKVYSLTDSDGNGKDDFKEAYDAKYKNIGLYTTETSYLAHPLYHRFEHGLLAFRTGAKVISLFGLHAAFNDPFDDFDFPQIYAYPVFPDVCSVYPTWEKGKLIRRLTTVGVQQGINDARYIATLERLIKENPNNKYSIKAKKYLESLKAGISPYWGQDYVLKSITNGFYSEILKNVSSKKDPNDFNAFTTIRNTIRGYIEKILYY